MCEIITEMLNLLVRPIEAETRNGIGQELPAQFCLGPDNYLRFADTLA